MEDALQRLLETERRAEQIARDADRDRERLISDTLEEARREEAQFEARIPELHAAFIEKADARAAQTISELKKRCDERHGRLREMAQTRENEALKAAFRLLIDAAL
jgi:vacuolar-type H+-ATPase subunit H